MSKTVRITGLVRVANAVRRELAGAITPARRDQLRDRVAGNVQEVLKILHANNARIDHLPAPSQRAYHFLANLDWNKVVTAESAGQTAAASVVSWRGLGAFLDRMLDWLARELTEAQVEEARRSIERTSRQIELSIQRQNLPPERLTPATREQRGWLALFSRPEQIAAYVNARKAAGRLLDAAASGSRRFPPPITIHFRPTRGIFKMRATRHGTILSLPTGMIAFDESGFTDLARLIFGDRAVSREPVLARMTGEGFQSVQAELEALGGIVETARGAVYDLSASFDRVNAQYFGGKMARPRLTWNRTFTGRKFGHYDWIADTVMVSRTLDASSVPEFVADFIMYHELLHKFHGLHWVNGRGYAHTSEFQRDERKFAQYQEAEAILGKLAREAR